MSTTLPTAVPPSRLSRTLAKAACAAVLALPALLPGPGYAEKLSPPNVPEKIQVQAGHVPGGG